MDLRRARPVHLAALLLAGGVTLAALSMAAAPKGNVARNPSVEQSLAGWRGAGADLVRVGTGAPHGRYVLRVTSRRAGPYGVSGPPSRTVQAAGVKWVVRVWVRAATTSAAGRRVTLVVEERTLDGRRRRWVAARALSSSFTPLTVSDARARRGSTLRLLVNSPGGRAGDAFEVDAVSIAPAAATTGPGTGGTPGAGGGGSPGTTPGTAPGTGGTGGGAIPDPAGYRPPFASSSPFNVALSATAALDPDSATKAAAMNVEHHGISYDSWSPAVYYATASDPLVTVSLAVEGSAVAGRRIRVPRGARPPSDVTDGSPPDNHMSVVFDGHTYSFWQAQAPSGGVLRATFAGMAKLDGTGSNIPGATGGRASGIAQIAGLITPEDVRSGVIRHALAMSANSSVVSTGFTAPAIRTDGSQAPSARTVKEGQRVRLPAGTDLSAMRLSNPKNLAFAKMIATALRDYGAIIVDKGGGGGGFYMVNPVSYTSLGLPNPWPALVGPLSAYGSYTNIVRDSGLPWGKLQVLRAG